MNMWEKYSSVKNTQRNVDKCTFTAATTTCQYGSYSKPSMHLHYFLVYKFMYNSEAPFILIWYFSYQPRFFFTIFSNFIYLTNIFITKSITMCRSILRGFIQITVVHISIVINHLKLKISLNYHTIAEHRNVWSLILHYIPSSTQQIQT